MNVSGENTNLIFGRNAVAEAIKSGRNIQSVFVQKNIQGAGKGILELARKAGVSITLVDKRELDRMSGEKMNHQGVACKTSPYEYADLDNVLSSIDSLTELEGGRLPLLILLDGIEDPHNLGAIMRTAECVGASGVVIPKKHSAGITDTVVKTSAGAVEYLPCVRVSNIAFTIDKLKEKGFWIYGCDMDGDSLWSTELEGKVAIVIGNEGSGISRLVREKCDFIVSIPMKGSISSLNASNAAAVVMYEVARQAQK